MIMKVIVYDYRFLNVISTPVEGSANSDLSLRFSTGLLVGSTTDVNVAVFVTPNVLLSFYTPRGLTSVFRGMNINLAIFLGRSCVALEIMKSEWITDKIVIFTIKRIFLFNLRLRAWGWMGHNQENLGMGVYWWAVTDGGRHRLSLLSLQQQATTKRWGTSWLLVFVPINKY